MDRAVQAFDERDRSTDTRSASLPTDSDVSQALPDFLKVWARRAVHPAAVSTATAQIQPLIVNSSAENS
jgi:hypothetical protein